MARVRIPNTSVAAFYLDRWYEVVAAEVLPRLPSREIKGVAHLHEGGQTPTYDAARADRKAVPPDAELAVYMDAQSRIVAIEDAQSARGREIRDLGKPNRPEDSQPCIAKCTINGPNGAYCLPGCS